jgi:23S rRNA (guanosine2251-2'-O)-methyltransferase
VARQRPDRAADRGPEQIVGLHPVLEALRARRRELLRVWLRPGLRRGAVDAVRLAAEAAGVPVAEREDLDPVASGSLSAGAGGSGVTLEAGPLPELELDALLDSIEPPRTVVALDGVEDPQNLGAIVRAAEASGAGGLVLTRRRAPPLSPAVARASAGAIEWLPTARVANLAQALERMKSRGYWVFGCEAGRGENVFALPDRVVTGDRVVVLGAEGRGLRPGIDRRIDHRVKIPMAGRVGSLNVSAAAAVVLFELARRTTLANFP